MNSPKLAGLILAAGKGTRMKSELPKGLHSVCGVPMVGLVARALKQAGVERPAIVIGHQGDLIIESLGGDYDYAWQTEQLGTGHAALMAQDLYKGFEGNILITPGDTPLIDAEALKVLVDRHVNSEAKCTVATVLVDDPKGYGRVVRDAHGQACRIVEEKDADADVKAVREVNSAIYCFDAATLFSILPALKSDNAQGEYYLTDVLSTIYSSGGKVEACIFDDPALLMGVNDRWQLAQAADALRERILKGHALNGVTLLDPTSTFIGVDVEIGTDTIIEPLTILEGNTTIGSNCRIGPNTKIQDSSIGDACTVLMSHLNETTMLSGSRCGPFANLRPHSVIGEKSKIGNFVEVKNARLGDGVAVSHLSYIGDGTVGDKTNIGAGTIFCNYDGYQKHQTNIGSNVFVGSNSTLVAPVHIGDGAMIAAGSVITSEVPADGMGIGRSRQEVKEGWAASWRLRKQQQR